MEPKVNYTTVGLFVIILVAVLIIGIFWLSGADSNQYRTYLVYINEPVSGLSQEAPVRFNGVDVGYVKSIQLNPKNPQQVELLLNIVEDAPINMSTSATLMMQGITGITFIGLTAKAVDAPSIPVLPGNDYPIIQSSPSVLVEVNKVIRDVSVNIKRAADIMNKLFDKNNQAAINNILQNSSRASQQLPSTAQNISQQAVPSVLQAINQLNNLINNLEQLTEEIQNNPSLLLRGKQPQPLGPGE